MTIRNKNNWANSSPDWTPLTDCFGNTKIRIGDVDGQVEHGGWLLQLEAKGKDVDLPRGQEIMFESITQDRSFCSVVVIWGVTKPTGACCENCGSHSGMASLLTMNKFKVYHRGIRKTFDPADIHDLKRWIRGWFEFTDRKFVF